MNFQFFFAGSTWSIPPGTQFIGYNITSRSQPSFVPDFKDRSSTYVDFNTRLRTGLLRQFQYFVDTQGAAATPVFVRLQIWDVLGTSYVSGVPTNYTVELKFEERHEVQTATGVYKVNILDIVHMSLVHFAPKFTSKVI